MNSILFTRRVNSRSNQSDNETGNDSHRLMMIPKIKGPIPENFNIDEMLAVMLDDFNTLIFHGINLKKLDGSEHNYRILPLNLATADFYDQGILVKCAPNLVSNYLGDYIHSQGSMF